MHRLVTQPGQEVGRWAEIARFQVRLWRFCARRLRENNLFAMSAALSFQTIFALIPLLVLGLLVARQLGAMEDSRRSLHTFLEKSGFAQITAVDPDAAPSTAPDANDSTAAPGATSAPVVRGPTVADYIENIVNEVEAKLTFQRIGPVGAALFIWTALSLITTMEDSLNRVFGAVRNRAMARRILLYWSVMTLGPVALTAASFLGQRALDACRGLPVLSWIGFSAGWFGPPLVGVIVLTCVYVLLPNTHVRWRAAVGGAVVATVLWLAAKSAFALYVERFVFKGNLYGILGVLPLFLMWLNFSWMLFLFGAEIAHTAAHARTALNEPPPVDDRLVTPTDTLAVALAVAQQFQSGGGPAAREEIAAAARLPAGATSWLLDHLVQARVVCSVSGTDEPRYVLDRPPEQVRVHDALAAARPEHHGQAASPSVSADTEPDLDAAIQAVVQRMDAPVRDMTLADCLSPMKPAPPPSA